jgi:predicted metal-dependent enzyme (double-stranded beta helix superfamily)
VKRKLVYTSLLSSLVTSSLMYLATAAKATTADGYTSTTLAQGRIGSFDVFNHFLPDGSQSNDQWRHVWLSWQKTKGLSDLYVQSNVWAPGGTTGWHSHPGHSLIIVTAGTVTNYESDDPECKPKSYSAGMAFVDEGGDHSHTIRNEGNVQAQTIAFQVIPADQPRRIDVPTVPGNCPF